MSKFKKSILRKAIRFFLLSMGICLIADCMATPGYQGWQALCGGFVIGLFVLIDS